MQVRSGNTAGFTDLTDTIAPADFYSGIDKHFIEMGIHAYQSLTMIDEDCITIKKIVAGCDHDTGCGCCYRRAQGSRDVQTRMGSSGLLIEKTP